MAEPDSNGPGPVTPPASPRRRKGLSVRVVLVLVAVVALGLGWVAYRIRLQQEGIALIRSHGGMYYYDFEYGDAKFPENPQSWAPNWARQLLGDDAFHHVAWVRIEGQEFDDADLARLMECLPRIESLGIVGTSITDEGLASFRGNRWLGGLFLGNNRITDTGIDVLDPRTLPKLEVIEVRATDVTAAKAAEVQEMFDAREAAAKKAQPGTRAGGGLVLTGPRSPGMPLGEDPRGDYERERDAPPAE